VAISVIKGKVDRVREGAEYQIDGLAGATLTTRGVNNLIQYWLGEEGFAPLIGHLKSGDA
jgi:Na+-transporting NADH:ubiquinone oxidoreductase subunit C